MLLPFFFAGAPAFGFMGNQEPWATPKGDARTDCAVLRVKQERFDKSSRKYNNASDILLELMKTKGREETKEWLRSKDNPLIKAEKEKDENLIHLQLARMNVVKHLGYDKPRLKEMWEWRLSNGRRYKKFIDKDEPLYLFDKNAWDINEISDFCKYL